MYMFVYICTNSLYSMFQRVERSPLARIVSRVKSIFVFLFLLHPLEIASSADASKNGILDERK